MKTNANLQVQNMHRCLFLYDHGIFLVQALTLLHGEIEFC
jgi:hypothetical protein